ncbi:MAG: protein translocase subunit SecF [Candidatus Magasanikbacteria bacterium]|nr:protein translocase subunit SecF [Candidatus Magasanikbacteria bacterium]
MKSIPFVKYSKLWVGISAVVMAAAVVMLALWRLQPGIDFTGGSLLELSFARALPAVEAVQEQLIKLDLKGSIVQKSGERNLLIRTVWLTEDKHQALLAEFRNTLGKAGNDLHEERFETIGAAVSAELKRRAIWAVVFVNLAIIIYIAYAFRRVSQPVASWKYGALAIVALLHDVLVVLGVFAVLGRFRGVEVDTAFVVAILTVLGYSVNDTIVVYDRVRERLLREGSSDFAALVNNGLNQTLMRSINTTLTTLLPLFALYFFGGASIRNFALALLIGIGSGAYSSIFVASPLLVLLERWQRRSKQ